MNCTCMNTSPGLRYVPNLMTDHYGRCKMCKGWRHNAPEYFWLRDIIRNELPIFVQRGLTVSPSMVWPGIRFTGNTAELGGDANRIQTVRIHRDDMEKFIMRGKLFINRARGVKT